MSKDLQQKTCNAYCNRENGPVCREMIEKNLRWPLAKANTTTKLKCLSSPSSSTANEVSTTNSNTITNTNTNNKSQKYAYRTCNIDVKHYNNLKNTSYINGYTNQLTASWQQINYNDCVNEDLRKLKQELYIFHTTDNFDESRIINYLQDMYDYCYKLIKFNPDRSIHDVSILLDSMFYIVNSQVFFGFSDLSFKFIKFN